MRKLRRAPAIAMIALHHHARPEYPSRSPAEKRNPETVGPKARERLAVEDETPLIVPSIRSEGAELVSRMALLGYAIVANVHFQMTIPYTPAIFSLPGKRTRYGVQIYKKGYEMARPLNRRRAPNRRTMIGKNQMVATIE